MNTSRLAAALLTLFAINAQAGEFDSMTIACPVERLPSQAEVAQVFDVQNFAKAYAMRERVVTFARRQCTSGIDRVQIVSDPAGMPAIRSAIAGAL